MMADVPALINISVSLKIQPNDGPVFFKADGSRFGQTRTIKLLTGSKYKIEVVIKPGSVEPATMGIGGKSFDLEQQSKDEESAVYHGFYDTEGVPHTKSGDRQPVQVSIQFKEAGVFETVWQVKYYNYYKREHCQFGNKFSFIEYEVKPNETRSLMWINKEVFQ
ncbi:CB1 cannabinoid receptor-interacting protein 1a [Pangasianodon hypophthalmus]|uniref:CB1 cannabinoid receptor-interacting protein 1a n=1 Tax=Pangasianodon hypophthalmus TaxID=310915 RepID=UPI000EFE20B0|nr:CB1 cannabinoid receptor-interacting protein 1a [Pangasianodon hypophthalmus]